MKSLIAFALVSLFSIAAQAQIWVGHDGRVVFEVEEAGKHTGYLVVTGEDSPQLAAEGLKPKTEHWCSFESTKGVPSSFDLAPVGDPTTTLKKAGFTLGLWDGRCHEKPRPARCS